MIFFVYIPLRGLLINDIQHAQHDDIDDDDDGDDDKDDDHHQ